MDVYERVLLVNKCIELQFIRLETPSPNTTNIKKRNCYCYSIRNKMKYSSGNDAKIW